MTGKLGRVADGDIESDPQIASRIEDRAVGILVVVPRQSPPLGHGFVRLRHTVAIPILQSGHFAPLSRVQRSLVQGQAKRFVQSRGKT
jgi:hypothetical protein